MEFDANEKAEMCFALQDKLAKLMDGVYGDPKRPTVLRRIETCKSLLARWQALETAANPPETE